MLTKIIFLLAITIVSGTVPNVQYKIQGEAVSGKRFGVTVVGQNFEESFSQAVVMENGPSQCNTTLAASTPTGTLSKWTIHDKEEWVIDISSTTSTTWGNTVRYVCILYRSTDANWNILDTAGGVEGFYVFSFQPSYTIRPILPVSAAWSGPLYITLHGQAFTTATSMMLTKSKSGCRSSPLPSDPVAGGNPTQWSTGDESIRFENVESGVSYVCLSVDSEQHWTVIPVDDSESGTVYEAIDRYQLTVYPDTFNFTDVFPSWSCGEIVAGVPSTCRLVFQDHPTNFTDADVAQFAITHLQDGRGDMICPFPTLIKDWGDTGPILIISFTPIYAGRLGRIRIMYKSSPIPLKRDVDDPLGTELEESPANVTGIPDDTLYRFYVKEPYLDNLEVGSEMVVNEGSEFGLDGWSNESASDPFTSGTCCGGWEIAHDNPASGWGLTYFTPTPGHFSRLHQQVSLTTSGAGLYRFAARFYHQVNAADPNFVASDTDATIRISWRSTSLDVTGEATISHTSATSSTIEESFIGSRTLRSFTFPYQKWESFVLERELAADVQNVLIIIESDARRGATVSFDEISVKKINFLRTSAADIQILENLYTNTNGASWVSNENWMTGDPCKDHWQGVHCDYSKITKILLPYNDLSGDVPDLSGLADLREIDLSRNSLTGGFRDLSNTVKKIDFSDNKLTWTGPTLPECVVAYDVSRNSIGNLPDNLWDLRYLETVDVSMNSIRGEVNDTSVLAPLLVRKARIETNPLRVLRVSGNSLQGELPTFSSSVYRSLEVLDFSSNQFNSTIPEIWGDSLPSLKLLYLYDNQLEGTLPSNLQHTPLLYSLTLSIKGNFLTGLLPAWIARVQKIDLRDNGFACPIPDTPAGVIFGHTNKQTLETCDSS
eukprot:TRINITY_DN22497_c0_g1_i1.p1 TRINITY_DN22497_c0_g1~~TRINITY_DN22497_c0_g1_i1.p1  ORF type:complete len:888 (+),score=87.37 TRINITY_DN22497_c0_g1_i1:65-2728(+)